jgi:hypothetical protein
VADLQTSSKFLRAGSLLLAFFVVRGAHAGEQLTLDQLVRDSMAVAVVDNPLRSGDVAVRRWLKGTEPAGSFSLNSPLCLPDKDMLLRWQKQSPKHPGAATWAKTLSVGHADQIVFFRVVQGIAVPRCETEVMLGTTFATHPDFDKALAEVERLLDAKLAAAVPAPAVPVPAPEPVAPAPAPAAPAPAPAPAPVTTSSSGSGCF